MANQIIVNLDIGPYKKGQKFKYSEAPKDIKFWADNESILVEKKICTIIKDRGLKPRIEERPRCLGIKKTGYRCRDYKILENGYCIYHQDQYKENLANQEGKS